MRDVHVFPKAVLDAEFAAEFDLDWLVQEPNGEIHQFETEDQACAFQVIWRCRYHLDPYTGEQA